MPRPPGHLPVARGAGGGAGATWGPPGAAAGGARAAGALGAAGTGARGEPLPQRFPGAHGHRRRGENAGFGGNALGGFWGVKVLATKNRLR